MVGKTFEKERQRRGGKVQGLVGKMTYWRLSLVKRNQDNSGGAISGSNKIKTLY